MPVSVQVEGMNELLVETAKINANLRALTINFPSNISIDSPAFRGSSSSIATPIVGEGDMQLLFYDANGMQYPPELQPSLTPTVNTFRYQQIQTPQQVFYITGLLKISNISQVPVDTLNDYNSQNNTNFGQETREKLILPINNTSGQDLGLSFIGANVWRNLTNGNILDWLEPISAIWTAGTNEIDLIYESGRYALLFGSNQQWDINLSFTGVASLALANE